MKEEMTKKTAVVAIIGIMFWMLTGCGEKKLDGSKTVATVDGTKIPLGVVSLSVREGQMQMKLCTEVIWAALILISGIEQKAKPTESRL